MAVDVRVVLIWLCSSVCLNTGLELVMVKEIPGGKVEVTWTSDGPENMEFSILYGEENVDGGAPIEWHALKGIQCCKAIISRLQIRTVYTFKIAANNANKYTSSASETLRMHEGFPLPPRNVTVNVQPEVSANSGSTCVVLVAWTENDPEDVEYYNVSLVLSDRTNNSEVLVLRRQASDSYVTFPADRSDMSLDVYVVAVNPYGTSQRVAAHHYTPDVTSTSCGGEASGVSGRHIFWVILAPVMTMFILVAAIAVGIHCNRRRSHLNFLRAKADNGLSYMPLRLSTEQPERWLPGHSPMSANSFAGRGGAESPRNNIYRTSLQGRRSEVNRIGHHCETSPHKAQFQLVSESPNMGHVRRGESLVLSGAIDTPTSSRPDSLMSAPADSPRTSKRTPIIPLSEEKLLSRVTTDPGRYPSFGGASSLGELMGSD